MPENGSVSILDHFVKVKNLPLVRRVSGGGVRPVYYRHPERIGVVRGRRVNGTRAAITEDRS